MPQNSGHTWTGNEDNRFIILWHDGNGGSWNSPRHDAEICSTHGVCPGAGGGDHSFASRHGFREGWEDWMQWNRNKVNPRDNIYIGNHYNGDTVPITDVKFGGSTRWTPTIDMNNEPVAARRRYMTWFTIKRNDKPPAPDNKNTFAYNIKTKPEPVEGGRNRNRYLKDDVWNYSKVRLEDGNKVDPCPGTPHKGFTSRNQITCLYNAQQLGALQGASKRPVQDAMYNDILNRLCKTPGNETKVVGNVKCTDNTKFMDVAQRYCETGANIKDVGKDATCGPGKYGKYHESAIKYCDKNPTDNWCRCYNAMKKCTKNMNGPGCQKFKTVFESYKKFKGKPGYTEAVNAIPCAAGCSLADVYRPRDMGDCPQNITICNAEVNVGSMQDSTVKVDQACSSGDAPSTDPNAATEGANKKFEEEQPTLTDFASNPGSYIPKSLGDLKTNKKAKAGVGGIGSSLIISICCVVLLLLVMSGGGSGPRRFRK
jgi:hypothetical protein